MGLLMIELIDMQTLLANYLRYSTIQMRCFVSVYFPCCVIDERKCRFSLFLGMVLVLELI